MALFRNARDGLFFDLLRAAAQNALATADRVSELCNEPGRFAELGPGIKELESKGDQLTHDLFELTNRTYVTPLESEDLAALARSIDSLVDSMEAAAARTGIYRVTDSDPFLQSFGQVLKGQTAELATAIDLLARKRLQEIHQCAVRVHQLENQGDDILRASLSALYDQAHDDPVRFITRKEIYEALEDATDRAKSVGNILDGVVMKHS